MSIDRRRLLQLAGGTLATGGLGALAGCSSSCPDTGRPTADRVVRIGAPRSGPFESLPAGRWPTRHGTPGRTGYAAGASLADAPALRWRTDLELPRTDAGGLSASAPAVGGGLVVVADSRRVHALSLPTGEVAWRSDPIAPTFYDAIHEYEANTVTPTVGPGGDVYVATGTGLVALDGDDGSVRWTVGDLTGVAPPAVADGMVYALGTRSVAAIDSDGEERWRRSVSREDRPAPPAVTGSTVVVATEGGLQALDPATGEVRWDGDRRPETHPVLADGTCFVGNDAGLVALDAADGTERWTFDRGDYRSMLSPIVTPDTIYVVEQPGEAGAASFALERTDGAPEPRWCSDIGSGAVAAATDELALGILALGEGPGATQSVVAFSSDLGQSPWAIEGGSSPRDWVTPPAVLDGAVVVTTRGGTVAAVGAGDGNG